MSNLKFEHLPNEVILKVLSYLKIEEIVRCHQVSKRIKSICHDESLWKNINLHLCDFVPAILLQLVLNNGCKCLSLNCSTVLGKLSLKKPSQLIYLDLTKLTATEKVKERLLASCHSLEKISLINNTLNKKMVRYLERWCHLYQFDIFAAIFFSFPLNDRKSCNLSKSC